MKNWSVYIHTNKANNKKYIGITSQDIKARWRDGKGYKIGYFGKAIMKYGWDGFEHDIVAENISESSAKSLERQLIALYNTSNSKYGYNLTYGGDGTVGYHVKDDVKKAVSEAQSIEVICEGKVFKSIKECAKYYNINYGTMKMWLRKKNKMPQKFIVLKLTYKNIDCNTYESQDSKNKHFKEVVCDGKEFKTIKECASHYNINESLMSMWLSGKVKMNEKMFNLGLRYKNDKETVYKVNKPKKRVMCDGMIFESVLECARYYDVNRSSLYDWIKGRRNMPEKFKELGLSYIDN